LDPHDARCAPQRQGEEPPHQGEAQQRLLQARRQAPHAAPRRLTKRVPVARRIYGNPPIVFLVGATMLYAWKLNRPFLHLRPNHCASPTSSWSTSTNTSSRSTP